MKFTALILILIVSYCATGGAKTNQKANSVIYLKNGERLVGKIWIDTEREVLIETRDGDFNEDKALVEKILYGRGKYRLVLKTGKNFIVKPISSEGDQLKTAKRKISWKKIRELRTAK